MGSLNDSRKSLLLNWILFPEASNIGSEGAVLSGISFIFDLPIATVLSGCSLDERRFSLSLCHCSFFCLSHWRNVSDVSEILSSDGAPFTVGQVSSIGSSLLNSRDTGGLAAKGGSVTIEAGEGSNDDAGNGGDGGDLNLRGGFANGRALIDTGGSVNIHGGDCEHSL